MSRHNYQIIVNGKPVSRDNPMPIKMPGGAGPGGGSATIPARLAIPNKDETDWNNLVEFGTYRCPHGCANAPAAGHFIGFVKPYAPGYCEQYAIERDNPDNYYRRKYTNGTFDAWESCVEIDAPADNKEYIRKNRAWVAASVGGGRRRIVVSGAVDLTQDVSEVIFHNWAEISLPIIEDDTNSPTAVAVSMRPDGGNAFVMAPNGYSIMYVAFIIRSEIFINPETGQPEKNVSFTREMRYVDRVELSSGAINSATFVYTGNNCWTTTAPIMEF